MACSGWIRFLAEICAPTDAVRLVEKVFAVAKRFLYSPNEVPTQDCTEMVADMSGSDLVMGSISSC